MSVDEGQQAVVLDGWFSNLDELNREFVVDPASRLSRIEFLIALYGEIGLRIFNVIEEEYALAVLDGTRVLLARDRLGFRPL